MDASYGRPRARTPQVRAFPWRRRFRQRLFSVRYPPGMNSGGYLASVGGST